MCKSTRQRNQTDCVKRFDILDRDGDKRAEEEEERRTDDWNETKASVIASKFFSPTSNQIVSGIAPNVCVIQHQQHLLSILYCVIQHPITFLFNSMLFSINSTFFASLSMILHCVIQHQHLLVHFFIALCYSASTLYFAASAIFFARCTMKLFFLRARILWEFLNDACNGDAFVITFLMIMIIMVMVILVTIQMIILMIMVFGDCEYS